MVITWGEPRRLGVPDSEARLRSEAERQDSGGGPGRRLLVVDGEPAFELSSWCGTCAFLFSRLETARQTLSPASVREQLTDTLTDPDADGVIDASGALPPAGEYLPVLLRVEPRSVVPGKEGDHFSGEQVATWGLDDFWGLPRYPHTPYYRTFETAVDASAHLYEFVVPMVPPTWNDRQRVDEYVELMGRGTVPTAVAVSTPDVCEPASAQSTDHYRHWGLTRFLLDGHHELEAAGLVEAPRTAPRIVPGGHRGHPRRLRPRGGGTGATAGALQVDGRWASSSLRKWRRDGQRPSAAPDGGPVAARPVSGGRPGGGR